MKILASMRHIGIVMFVALLVACAAPPVAPTPTLTTVASPALSPLPTLTMPRPSPTPVARPLRLWVAEKDAALAAVCGLVDAYQETSGVPILCVPKPPDGLRLSVAGTSLTGEAAPDMIWADQETLAGLLSDGYLQPVVVTGDPLPGLLTAVQADGALWGVPLTAQGLLFLLYNQQMTTDIPTTSDALITRSRAGDAGLLLSWDEPRWLLPWLHGFAGSLTDDAGNPSLDTPAMVAALNLLQELAVAAPTEVKTYRGGQRWFGEGEVAFAVDGDWALAEYRTLTETLDLGIAPLPVIPATGQRALPLIGGTFLMFHRDLSAADLDHAQAFAAFLELPTTQAELAHTLARLPASRTALDAPVQPTDPAYRAAATMALRAPGLPPTQAARCALFGIDVWLPSLLRGNLDPAETAAEMQGEADACVTK